jgi:hypothetical protein
MRKTRWAGLAAPEAERRLRHVLGAAVRDPDAALEAGRHLLLAGGHVGEEALEVGDAPGGHQPLGQAAGARGAVGRLELEVDDVDGDEV